MTYTLAGFTFTFTQDANGNVIAIGIPALGTLFPATTLSINPALTVAGAEALVQGLLTSLGISF